MSVNVNEVGTEIPHIFSIFGSTVLVSALNNYITNFQTFIF